MNFVKGDTVKVGPRGGVEYWVTEEMRGDGKVEIQSQNTGKYQWIGAGRLVPVQSQSNGELTDGDKHMRFVASHMTEKEVEQVVDSIPEGPEKGEPVNNPMYSSYGRAILAGLQKKAHVFQGLINPNKKRSARITRRARKLAAKNKKG